MKPGGLELRLLAAAVLIPQAVAGQLTTSDLRVQPVVTIGREGDPVTFHRIAQVAVAPTGEIVVADAGNARVVILGSDGRLVATVGRRGSGPGEFDSPWRSPWEGTPWPSIRRVGAW